MLVVRHRMCLYSTYAARSRLCNIIIFLLIFNFLKNITKIIMKLNITITCKSYIYIYMGQPVALSLRPRGFIKYKIIYICICENIFLIIKCML